MVRPRGCDSGSGRGRKVQPADIHQSRGDNKKMSTQVEADTELPSGKKRKDRRRVKYITPSSVNESVLSMGL